MNQPALPAFLTQRQSRAVGKTLAENLGQGSPPYLSILGGRFTLVDAAGNETPYGGYDQQAGVFADVVIIDVGDHISKIYYNTPFDPAASQWMPPACFSDNGVAPSRNASSPQAPTCAACPNNAWGSATSKVSGKGIKACSDYQKVALLAAGFEPIFLLRVPPNSLSRLREYTHRFNGQQIDPSDVITRISFEPGVQGTLIFQAVNYIDQPMFEKRERALLAKATDGLVGRNDVPHPMAASLPANQPVAQLAVPAGTQFQPNPPPAQQNFQAPAGSTQAPAGAQSAPAGNAGFPLTGTAPPQQQGQPAQAASPSEPKPRGRPRRNTAAQQPGGEPAPQQAPVQAPFRQQAPTGAAPAVPAQQNFGIAPGVAPNPELAQTLQGLFPTRQ